MLQIDVMPYASDALEDAMRLAQTKALNSYTYSDCLNYLNYAWRDIYDRMAMIDDGYYGRTVQLTKELTHLPDFVRNTVMVYAAQEPVGFNRQIFRDAGTADLTAPMTYRISGKDLYCRDASRRKVWLYYVPACAQLFFTNHNRDPITYPWNATTEGYDNVPTNNQVGDFGIYELQYSSNDGMDYTKWAGQNIADMQYKWRLHRRSNTGEDIDVTNYINISYDPDMGPWAIEYINCYYPYIFVTWISQYGRGPEGQRIYKSGFYDRNMNWTTFNGFDYTGQKTNVKFIHTEFNDKTGMGVTLLNYNMKDANDPTKPACQTVGCMPDSKLKYPVPEMYRYLVARLADKFSALNESNIMGVQKELVEAKFAFEAFLEKDKSAWKRIENVNPATIGDWL